eukprot:TRINITY_DN11030_c1_g1_i1.p1 TRINITY_DN11030_c1_g1~~TRINITY_DN11030_c1_g1_i1.p1  ORF type:complete len:115 (+),score=14.41 TRINITY_DN11030_c1_g1_i1:79-423(+)
MASSELLAGLHSLRQWADETNDHFKSQQHGLGPASPGSPEASMGSPSCHPALAGVRDSLKKLRKDAPRWLPMDANVSASPTRDSGVNSPQFVAQTEANRFQYAIKRRRMKPLPS